MSCADSSVLAEEDVDMCTNPADLFMENRHPCCSSDTCLDSIDTMGEICEFTADSDTSAWELPSCCDIEVCDSTTSATCPSGEWTTDPLCCDSGNTEYPCAGDEVCTGSAEGNGDNSTETETGDENSTTEDNSTATDDENSTDTENNTVEDWIAPECCSSCGNSNLTESFNEECDLEDLSGDSLLACCYI